RHVDGGFGPARAVDVHSERPAVDLHRHDAAGGTERDLVPGGAGVEADRRHVHVSQVQRGRRRPRVELERPGDARADLEVDREVSWLEGKKVVAALADGEGAGIEMDVRLRARVVDMRLVEV